MVEDSVSMPPDSSSHVRTTQAGDVRWGDIAVIGVACRFPGARNANQYWENLISGRISIGEVPPARWRWQDYAANLPDGGGHCRWGGFIDDVDAFDAAFFNVSAREAQSMDPQQRLSLELAWSCFEDAGIRPSQLSGGNVGVFLGFTNLDYKEIMELAPIDLYYATGTLSSVIPNRISYQFNLRGPSVAVDTACSSSLNAIHLACRALHDKECEVALAGGISLLLTPKRFLWYGKAGILSPTGTLKAFDDNADGTVRGEGAGFILLKPLVRAIADGNRVIGVIKGSAVNHGGKTHTLTYPSANAQAEVIVNALRTAGVTPSAVTYVEAHGTGTVKGDPIEVQGLVKAFQSQGAEPQGGNGDHPWCGLGSVKANIGHLEGAAGIAGIIKVLLALQHKTLPPLVSFSKLNSRICLGGTFYLVNKVQPWQPGPLPRVAGVSSFGFAGTNAHVILAEAPISQQQVGSTSRGKSIIVLSANNSERLQQQAKQLEQAIAARGLNDSNLPGVAFTLQVGREALPQRIGMTVRSTEELKAKLEKFVGGQSGVEGLYVGEEKKDAAPLDFGGTEATRQEAISAWIERGEWSKLLELWVQGMNLDWEKLYGELKPEPISLPTYPFCRERFWISSQAASIPATAGCAILHPLVHQNTSDLGEQRFSSVFTGHEFFLADHQIQGQRLMPAVAYLEMAREAVARAVGVGTAGNNTEPGRTVRVKNLVWLRPLVVGQEPVEVHIAVFPQNGGEVGFEVYSASGSGSEVVHAQGGAATGTTVETPRLDVEDLARRYGQGSYSSEACYAAFNGLGIQYGSGHRGIEGLHVEGDEVVARLSQPASESSDRFVLHPGVMDSGLQAIIGFALASGSPNSGTTAFVPFELRNAEVYGPCASKMWAVVRRDATDRKESGACYDIDLCDEAGRVCVRLNGLRTHFEVAVPEKATLATNQVFSLSPDGSRLAFFAMCSDGMARIWICSPDSSEVRVLQGSESPFFSPFFWSPNGRSIAFDAGGKLKAIDIADGSVRTLCPLRGNAVGGSWNRQGTVIFGQDPGHGLMKISADGGTLSPLTAVDSLSREIRHVLPCFLPDGDHFIYLRVFSDPSLSGIYLGSLSGKGLSSRLLATELAAMCVPSSENGLCYLLFVSDWPLVAQLFDAKRMELIGERHTLVEQIGHGRDFALFSASQNGILAYKRSGNEDSQLFWFDRAGKPLYPASKVAPYLMHALSPDERRVAIARIGPEQGICSIDCATGASTQEIVDAGVCVYPTWSHTGDTLIFSSNRKGNFDLYKKRIGGLENEELLVSSEDKFPSDCSPEGDFLLYTVLAPSTKYDLWVLSLRDGESEAFLQTEFNECHGRFSPCGSWVAYMSDETGQYEVYVRPFSRSNFVTGTNSLRHAISQGGGFGPRWRSDGRELYYLTPDRKVVAVDVTPGPVFWNGAAKVLFQAPPQSVGVTSQWAVACNGECFLVPAPAESGDKSRLCFHVIRDWDLRLQREVECCISCGRHKASERL